MHGRLRRNTQIAHPQSAAHYHEQTQQFVELKRALDEQTNFYNQRMDAMRAEHHREERHRDSVHEQAKRALGRR